MEYNPKFEPVARILQMDFESKFYDIATLNSSFSKQERCIGHLESVYGAVVESFLQVEI